jgi:UDP-N-acetylglucosamine 4,6-dehydratase
LKILLPLVRDFGTSSRGSIVETLLSDRGAQVVQITHNDMTRFWINYEQACHLVTYALTEMQGGEIFIPKIPSMKLDDLFTALVPQAKREVVGIRPGEKLHEILLTEQEARHALELDKYYVILPEFPFWSTQGIQKYHQLKIHDRALEPYVSDSNSLWLTGAELLSLLKIT